MAQARKDDEEPYPKVVRATWMHHEGPDDSAPHCPEHPPAWQTWVQTTIEITHQAERMCMSNWVDEIKYAIELLRDILS